MVCNRVPQTHKTDEYVLQVFISLVNQETVSFLHRTLNARVSTLGLSDRVETAFKTSWCYQDK